VVFLQIRGEGLVLGIEFIGSKDTLESFPAEWGMSSTTVTFFYAHKIIVLGRIAEDNPIVNKSAINSIVGED
jgi:hypothetical protein